MLATTTTTTQETPVTPAELLERIVRSARPMSTRTAALERRADRLFARFRAMTAAEQASPQGQALRETIDRLLLEIARRDVFRRARATGLRGLRVIPAEALAQVVTPWRRLDARPADGTLVAQPLDEPELNIPYEEDGERYEVDTRLPLPMPDSLRRRADRFLERFERAGGSVTLLAVYPAVWGEPRELPEDPLLVACITGQPYQVHGLSPQVQRGRGGFYCVYLLLGRWGDLSAAEAAIVERSGA